MYFLCAAFYRKSDRQAASEPGGGVPGHRGQTCGVCVVSAHSCCACVLQRISLVSSFAASLFLGGYAAIDFSDGTVCVS